MKKEELIRELKDNPELKNLVTTILDLDKSQQKPAINVAIAAIDFLKTARASAKD